MNQEILRHLSHHLELFRKIFKTETAYIAGGALRDLDNDKPIKDIDIFVYADERLKTQAKYAIKEESRRLTYAGDLDNIYQGGSDCLIKDYGVRWPLGLRIFDIRTVAHKPFPLQLVLYHHGGHRGPKSLLKYFDIDLCKISFDGTRVYRSDEYKKDVENKTITVNAKCAHRDRTLKRIDKLKAKYPDFESVIPEPVVEIDDWSGTTNIDLNELFRTYTVSSTPWTGR